MSESKNHARISVRVATCTELGAIAQVYIFIVAQKYPSLVDVIADGIGRDRRTVQRAIKRLTEAGLLRVERRTDRRGRSMSNLYLIARDKNGAALAPSGDTDARAADLPPSGSDAVPADLPPMSGDPAAHGRHSAPPMTESLTLDSTRSLRSREARACARDAPEAAQPELLMPIKGGKSNGRRRSPIPPDWSPSEEDREYARKWGYDHRWIDEQTERFRDTYLGSGDERADWSAVWRRWVQRGGDFAKANRKIGNPELAREKRRSGFAAALARRVAD